MTTDNADDGTPVPRRRPRVSIEELARRQGVPPVTSLDAMARDVFASDDDLGEFVAFVRADRRQGSGNGCGPSSWTPMSPPRPSSRTPTRRLPATCIAHDVALATLNTKDFTDFAEHDGLVLLPP